VLAGFVMLALGGTKRWDAWAMLVGAGLSVLLLNWLFRLGASGDRERQAEEDARAYFAEHGRWPDD
jgi:hypothetical protein